MEVYKVTFQLSYPESGVDIRTAYVLADSFSDAVKKVEKNKRTEYEAAYVKAVKLLDAEIFI